MIQELLGNKEGGGGFMMPNLFLVLLMSLGIVASESPVKSHRPAASVDAPEPGGVQDEILPNRGVANHLWEDPLALLDAGEKTAPLIGDVYKNWILGEKFSGRENLCLVVGLPGGTSSSAVENRIRIRSAVSSALLAKEQYYYEHGASLQVARWDYSADTLTGGTKKVSVPIGYSRLYRPYSSEGEGDNEFSEYRKIFVLYIDESAWGGDFGKYLYELFEELRFKKVAKNVEASKAPENVWGGVDWAYVGLTNSHRLHEFVAMTYPSKSLDKVERRKTIKPKDEPKKNRATKSEVEILREGLVELKRWDDFRVITPHATIDSEIFSEMFWSGKVKSIFEKAEPKPEVVVPAQMSFSLHENKSLPNQSAIESPVETEPGKTELKIERLMAHDGLLAAGLIEELGKRHICPVDENESGKKEGVLLLSEMDSFYGRSIAKTFQNKWNARYKDHKDQLVTLHYQLGLDGHQQSPDEVAGGGSGKDGVKLESAEGRSQIDSVTRLVGRIRTLESRTNVQFKAIGVLGSDVYDKLLLLRALRPEFHEARFFTTDLDARLWQGKDRMAARNLIVASSPLFHGENREKLKVPPFRSHYQLGTYEAIQAALRDPRSEPAKTKDGKLLCRPSDELGIYEIGKNGPVFLGGYREEDGRMTLLEPDHGDLAYPPEGFSSSHFTLLLTVILMVFLYCCWPHVAPIWRVEKFGDQAAREWPVRDRFFCGVYSLALIYLGSLVIRLQYGWVDNIEPVRLMDGVSVWPTVIFNILISMLALCWMIRSWKTLSRSHKNLKDCFPFNCGARISPVLDRTVKKFDRGGSLHRRLIRTGGLFLAYVLIYSVLLTKLPSQNIDNLARGDLAAEILGHADMIAHFCMAILLFFICDAVFLFSHALHFGKTMVKSKTFDFLKPEAVKSKKFDKASPQFETWSKPGMSDENFARIEKAHAQGHPQAYWQTSMLELGVQRAKTIGSLLYYPFICLFFLFIARNTIFDDFALSERLVWTYLLVFALLAGAIVYSQYALQRLFVVSAEAIRRAIESNPGKVAEYYEAELKELREMKEAATYGIFNNPLFKAAIIPIGGSGILEMVSHLAPILRGG